MRKLSGLRRASALLAVALCAPALAGCGPADGGAAGTKARTLTVLAASSLTGTFEELKRVFESEHDGVSVKVVYDSSATLAEMAEQQAPGDVLATADKKTMDGAVAGKGVKGEATQFASNVVVLAVPAENPARISTFTDIDKPGVTFLTCVPTAPCGSASVRLLDDNKISAEPASQEVDVKSVLAKLVDEEADAGMVYQTDVTASKGKVNAIDVPGAKDDPNTYWVAVTSGAEQRGLARDWLTLMTGKVGRAVFAEAGFGPAR